jgi:hypothetical protein
MSKLKPNIITPFNDKQRFKDLVLEVINDTSVYAFIPDSISLNDGLFILTLTNKKFVYEEIKVDGEPDYVDVYLQGIKKTANTYSVSTNGNDIIITFTESIALRPIDIVRTDFLVKGKIVSRQ